jgi:organic radical activating enzyme
MNIHSNKTLCVLPFIEQHYDLQGRQYFCCHANRQLPLNDQTDPEIIELKQSILAGVEIPQCTSCYTLEKDKVISPRQINTIKWFKFPEIKSYIETWVPTTPTIIYSYDLRFDSKCNLACISCNENDSSLWAKELGIDRVSTSLYFDKQKLFSAKKIYFAGGEPLIIDQYIDILEFIADNNIDVEVVINTNLTVMTDRIVSKIAKIKNCCLTISVDAYGSVNEYHRYPMSWLKFIKNLAIVKEHGIKHTFNTVADAVSVFGFGQLLELEDYPMQWNLTVLTHPNRLLLENIPLHLKDQALESVRKLTQSKFYKTDIKFRSTVSYILTQIAQPGDSFLLSNYINTLDIRRKINHQDYLGVNLIEENK